ncbi:TVP38/TMEM64 family protein [Clostridium sp. HMP27]|uniref:TVP38/TMEM64 family protein n=1 Tax=Clostridium sp. HMP27 TaxID=1487921 RepID=UPI00068D1286|nr:TVP38/TMEM64 family protein [Clostridium sp. HMP27]
MDDGEHGILRKAVEYIKENIGGIIFIGLFVLFLFVGYKYFHDYFYILKDPDEVRNIINSYGQYSILAFILLQMLQVVVFFIPGEIVQVAGGYIFGTISGSIISLVGICLGSIIIFVICNIYGKPFVERIISKRHLTFFKKVLKLGSVNYIVFLLYLVPGIPKDALAYICGISDISLKNFIIYSTLGRFPGIFLSAYFGAKIGTDNKLILIGIAVVATVLFILGVIKGEKIIKNMIKNEEKEKP